MSYSVSQSVDVVQFVEDVIVYRAADGDGAAGVSGAVKV